jgi:hypothetical protein
MYGIEEKNINKVDTPVIKRNFLTRVAWYDKIMRQYCVGSWHHKENINEKIKWVQVQNKSYPFTHYWLEGCYIENNENIVDIYEKNIDIFPNIETFNVIPVYKNNSSENNSSEYILL